MTQAESAPKTRAHARQWAVLLVAVAAGVGAATAGVSLVHYGIRGVRGNRVFYDQYHTPHRHLIDGENVRGEWDYHVISGYAQFRRALEDAGYSVHVNREPFGPGDLDGYDIFFVGEEARNGPEMTRAERHEILRFVKNGGGLWAVTEHTNAHQIGTRFNKLMKPTGIQCRYDSVCENNGTRGSRDWLDITDFRPHPVTRHMQILYTYNGCSFDTKYGIAFSGPNSFSDVWNPDATGRQRGVYNGDNVRQPDELAGPFPVVAARDYGRGHVLAICDHNALSNTNIRDGSHTQMLLDGMAWLGHRRWNPETWLLLGALAALGATLGVNRRWSVSPLRSVLAAAAVGAIVATGVHVLRARLGEPKDVFFLDAHGGSSDVVHKKEGDSFSMLVKHADKSKGIRTWSEPALRAGDEVIVLAGPIEPFVQRELALLDQALNDGRTIVYLATRPSIGSPAGQQLARHYEFEIRPRSGVVTKEIRLAGDRTIRGNLRKLGLRRPVSLSEVVGQGRRVRLSVENGDLSGDFITELPRKGGRVVVVAPAELFANANMGGRTERTLAWIDFIGQFFRWL